MAKRERSTLYRDESDSSDSDMEYPHDTAAPILSPAGYRVGIRGRLIMQEEANKMKPLYSCQDDPAFIEHVKHYEEIIQKLTEALNESREQIQALLDFCFTDRSKWKEGQAQRKEPHESKEIEHGGTP